eukprot:1765555-Prymnesium_polylepis.2
MPRTNPAAVPHQIDLNCSSQTWRCRALTIFTGDARHTQAAAGARLTSHMVAKQTAREHGGNEHDRVDDCDRPAKLHLYIVLLVVLEIQAPHLHPAVNGHDDALIVHPPRWDVDVDPIVSTDDCRTWGHRGWASVCESPPRRHSVCSSCQLGPHTTRR